MINVPFDEKTDLPIVREALVMYRDHLERLMVESSGGKDRELAEEVAPLMVRCEELLRRLGVS